MSPTAIKLIAECRSRGISLRGEGGKLKVSPPPERLPEELREALRRHKTEVLALLQREPSATPNYQALYRETAEAVREDCFLIDPAWLLEHPGVYYQIKALDDRLTTMERLGASEQEYGATLTLLMNCVHDARAASEQDLEQAGEMPAVQ